MAQVLVESPETQAFGFDMLDTLIMLPVPEQGIHTTESRP